jgi:hypothetical protein
MSNTLNTIENVWHQSKGRENGNPFPVSVVRVTGKMALVKPINPQLQLGTFKVRLSSLYNSY